MSYFVAKFYDAALAHAERRCLAAWRREMLGPLAGSVLEIGSGTGINLEHYGPEVERLVLAEPDRHMRRKLADRLSAFPGRARIVLTDCHAESLGFASGTFDSVVCTLVLCSVRDPERSLAEAFRVLRPGGQIVLLEHIRAPEGSRRYHWQKRLDPLWSRFANGCHLDRDPRSALAKSGFFARATALDELRGAPGLLRTVVRGTWQKPA